MSNCKYLKIKFKKYNVAFNQSDKSFDNLEKIQINAFGYYDIIKFDTEENILGFKPGKDAEFDPDIHEFKTEYVLKLIKIGTICGDEEAEFWGHRENENIKYPFMAIVSVDLNDKQIEKALENNKLFKNIEDFLTEVKGNTGYNDYCSAYFCIGYTDIVVLLQSNSLVQMNNYITSLREYTNNFGSYVSSTYTVFGLVKPNVSDYTGGFAADSIDLTVRWAYKDAQNCNKGAYGGFFDKLNKLNKSNNFDIEYGVFDRSCKICCSTEEIYNLYNDRNEQDNPYRSNACGIKIFNTKLNFSKQNESMFCDKVLTQNFVKINSLVKDALNDFLKEYFSLIQNNHLHKRLFSAMKNMEEFYELIITSEHSRDIERIVGNFYKESLYSFIEVIKYLNKNLDNKAKQIENFEEALEKFRNCVQFLLFDILRSDHSYFEVPSIAHPSIGSTTKLLLAYNRIVNKWNNAFSEHDRNQNSKLTFLITSGGSDGTTVTNLLWKFEDTALTFSDCWLPIIITIPEASLYDFKGTLARLAHEFFHFKGNRLRKGMTLDSGEKILGRYAHFYRGMLYEYIDYCCYAIGEKDNHDKCDAFLVGINDNPIASEDFKKYLQKLSVYTVSDDSGHFSYEDKFIKGNGKSNYAVLAGKELQRQLFRTEEDIPYISAFIDVCLLILCNVVERSLEAGDITENRDIDGLFELKKSRLANEKSPFVNSRLIKETNDNFNSFCNSYTNSENITPEQIVIEFLRDGLYKYFKNLEDSSNHSETTKYIEKSMEKAFNKYSDGEFNALNLFDRLFYILSYIKNFLPFDAYSYAISQTNEIPQGITQLSAIFCKITYEKYAKLREAKIDSLGIVYSSDAYGLDEYNITKNLNDTVNQNNVVPMTDYYSREWLNVSLKFFLGEYCQKPNRHKPMNYQSYIQFLIELYRECYADLCALCLLCNSKFVDNSADAQDSYKFELFKEYVGAFLSEQLDIEKLFGIDNNNEVDPKIALRICAVYEAFMGVISKGNNRKTELSAYLVNQYEIVNNKKLNDVDHKQLCENVLNRITILFNIYEKLAEKKNYVVELVEYLKACKSYAFQGVELSDSLNVQYGEEDWLLNNWLDIYK